MNMTSVFGSKARQIEKFDHRSTGDQGFPGDLGETECF